MTEKMDLLRLKDARVLLTGGSGFVGRHVIAVLAGLGADLTLLARPSSSTGSLLIRRIDLPVISESAILKALKGEAFDVVINIAAYGVRPLDRNPIEMFNVNVALPVWLSTHVVQKGGGFVSIGSSAEYDHRLSSSLRRESDPLETARLYGASKAACGALVGALSQERGVRSVHLRLFNVFGPGESEHRLFRHLMDMLLTKRPASLSSGLQVRDFVGVADVADAIIRSAAHTLSDRPPEAVTVNVCSGSGVSVRSFCEMIADVLEADRSLLGFGETALRPDDVPILVGDPTLAWKILGWAPSDLNEAIKAAVATAASWATGNELAPLS